SVSGESIFATFISLAAEWSDSSAILTAGMYRKRARATVFNSGVEARYFFSTASTAAALGLVSTHLAPFNRARVALAAVSGLASTHLPFAITSQQYSSLKDASIIWSAMFLTLPSDIKRLPMGSALATASTS